MNVLTDNALDPQALLARAKAETGLSDWGDPSFEERLGLAVNHINGIPMDGAGRRAAAENINWLLTDRLKFFEDRKLYPLDEEVIDHPMFATGEPRSGTTLCTRASSSPPSMTNRSRSAASSTRYVSCTPPLVRRTSCATSWPQTDRTSESMT